MPALVILGLAIWILVALSAVTSRGYRRVGWSMMAVVAALALVVAGVAYNQMYRWTDHPIDTVLGNGDPVSTTVFVPTGCYREVVLSRLDESSGEISVRVRRRGTSMGDCRTLVRVDLEVPVADRVLIDKTSGNMFRGNAGRVGEDGYGTPEQMSYRWPRHNVLEQLGGA